jgi:hypothetical protein
METQQPASINGAKVSENILLAVTIAFNSMGNELVFIVNPYGWTIQTTPESLKEYYSDYRNNQILVRCRVMRKRDFFRILGRLIAQEIWSTAPDRMVSVMTPTGRGNGYAYSAEPYQLSEERRQSLAAAYPHLLRN